ncbi:MAG: HAD family phosphatase [Simkania sp.]|nr:HAD family phosphatase [Simkania sp.]MCB1074603.1 HAD family phosphatase [Simkania sp.]MCP5490509.1 HAD family phosphatase [Chlamydiales bacterium]
MMKGTIALDIDGTITAKDHMIPDRVAAYFETLHRDGWKFILVTGRIFSFAMMTLTKLNFPFLLGVQNGADLLVMPERKRIKKNYLKLDVLKLLDELYTTEQGDFIVYAGYDKGDFCYYRPTKHSPKMLTYLEKLTRFCAEPWQPVETFDLHQQSTFPLVKCFGTQAACEAIEEKLKSIQGIQTSVIKDPIDPSLYLVLVTHANANKGSAVKDFMEKFSLPRPLITGGDDNNDIPLLRVGDMRIAMDGAPDALQNLADIIAPPAEKGGIVEALQEAMS